MIQRLFVLAAAAVLLLGAPPLHAQTDEAAADGTETADPKAVDVESNEMEIFDAERKAIFRGNVDATRGTTNLKADTLTVIYSEVKQPDGSTKTDATDLDAKGNVTITTAKETITGDWAKYNPQTDKLIVGGDVTLVQGKTVLKGNQLNADLKTDRMQMTGGRVKGSFLPK